MAKAQHSLFHWRHRTHVQERLSTSDEETARCYYAALRLEINQHLQIVNQIYTLYLGGVTALFVASLSIEGKFNLLLLVPFLSLGAANLLGSHERTIGCIAAYCAVHLDKVLNKNDVSVIQWDNSIMLDNLKNRNFISNQNASLSLIVAPGLAALVISILKFLILNGFHLPLQHPLVLIGWFVGIICICFTVSIIEYTARYRKEMGEWHNRTSSILSR